MLKLYSNQSRARAPPSPSLNGILEIEQFGWNGSPLLIRTKSTEKVALIQSTNTKIMEWKKAYAKWKQTYIRNLKKNGMRNMVFFFRLFYSFIVQFFVLFVSYHISMDEKEEYNVALKWTQNHFGKHLFTHNIFALHHVSTWDKAEKSFAHFLLK